MNWEGKASSIYSASTSLENKSARFCGFDRSANYDSCIRLIENHYFNHLVSVVLPNTVSVPSSIFESLGEDNVYYRTSSVNIFEILEEEFIDAFVKRGKLYVLSDLTRVDVDDCVCITPTGYLVLNLQRETYLDIGIDGKPSSSCKSKPPSKHIVRIDLKTYRFNPDKKKHLQENQKLKFNLLIAWEPPDESICPSSVAAHLHSKGYGVSACKPRFCKKLDYNVLVPEMGTDYCPEDVIEWLGAFSLNVDLKSSYPSDDMANYLTSYLTPEPAKSCAQVASLQWTGYFTREKILKLFESLKNHTSQKEDCPWISMYVQGFGDSPVSWSLKEHDFYEDRDNEYTIFFQSNSFLVYSAVIPTKV